MLPMKYLPALMLVFCLALNSKQLLAAEKISCKRGDTSFAAFLQNFRTDRKFRVDRIEFPLNSTFSGHGERSATVIGRAEAITGAKKIPIPPSIDAEEQSVNSNHPHRPSAVNVHFRIAPNEAVVSYSHENEILYSQEFRFAKRGACWFLVEHSDSAHS